MSHWAAKYIGVEFEEKGRGPRYDCLGLIRACLKNEFDIAIPSYAEEYESTSDRPKIDWIMTREIEALSKVKNDWRNVESPRAGDIVMFYYGRHINHCGLMVNDLEFLHIQRGKNACIQGLDDMEWCKRIEGYYRHASRI